MIVGKFSKIKIQSIFLIFFFVLTAQAQKNKATIQAAAGGNGNGGGIFTFAVTPKNILNFGTFSVDQTTGGSITVGFDGSINPSPGINFVPFGASPSAGEFEITVTQGKATVTFASMSSLLTKVGGGTISVDNLTFSANQVYVDKFNTPYGIKLGGTLTIPSNTPPGIYSGTINVILTYQ